MNTRRHKWYDEPHAISDEVWWGDTRLRALKQLRRTKRVQRRRLKRAQRKIVRLYECSGAKRALDGTGHWLRDAAGQPGGWCWTQRLGKLGDELARRWAAYFELD